MLALSEVDLHLYLIFLRYLIAKTTQITFTIAQAKHPATMFDTTVFQIIG